MQLRTLYLTAVFGAVAALLGACGPGAGEGEPQPVDHETTVQTIDNNSARLSESFTRSVQFIEGSKLLDSGAAGLQMEGGGSGSCSPDGDCTTSSDIQVETDTSSQRKEAVQELKEHVFNEDYVVSETNTSITYQIPGKEICTKSTSSSGSCTVTADGEETCSSTTETSSADYEKCKKRANKMNYRIRVTSPSEGNLVFHVFVGSQNYNPVIVELFKNHIASEVSLADIKKTAELYDRVYNAEVAKELPSTFQGRIRSKFERLARKKVRFETLVKAGIDIGGGDYSFKLGAASKPVFGITADGVQETITSTVDFDAIEASFPATHYEYQSGSSSTEPREKEFQHLLHLAGLTGQTTLNGNSDKIKLEKLGLGDTTSWLKIGGEKVVTLDLNSGAGRQFQATFEPADNGDSLKVSVRPTFDLDLALKFKRIADQLQISPDWALDDEITVDLTGASPASVVLGSGYMEVVKGVFKFGSTSAGVSKSASAGQCVVESETSSSGSTSTSTTEESEHPVEYFSVAQCAN